MHLRTTDGGTGPGSELVDRFWDGMVRWATVKKPVLDARRSRETLEAFIREHPEADRIMAEFEAAGGA